MTPFIQLNAARRRDAIRASIGRKVQWFGGAVLSAAVWIAVAAAMVVLFG